MNGPEHYREAERLVGGDESDQRAAQVHATLALAAAVALSDEYRNNDKHRHSWIEVAG